MILPNGFEGSLHHRYMLQVEFVRRHKFDYEAVAGEEYQVLKPDLVKVQESIGNSAFANEVKQTTSKDAFFKVGLPCRHLSV